MEFVIDVDREIDGLTDELANSIWQLLVYSAPYDTGNLRTAIKKSASNKKRILFIYDETQAYYLTYLEEGVGFVKKYKGFIENLSVGESVKEILYWAQTGKNTYDGIPIVSVRGRLTQKANRSYVGAMSMGYEKNMLRDNRTQITARERAELSKLYYKRGNNGQLMSVMGKSVEIDKSPYTSKTRFSTKGME